MCAGWNHLTFDQEPGVVKLVQHFLSPCLLLVAHKAVPLAGILVYVHTLWVLFKIKKNFLAVFYFSDRETHRENTGWRNLPFILHTQMPLKAGADPSWRKKTRTLPPQRRQAPREFTITCCLLACCFSERKSGTRLRLRQSDVMDGIPSYSKRSPT